MEETGVKVHIPPPSVMKDEISIAGEKQGVQTAKERILQIFEEMVCLVFQLKSTLNCFGAFLFKLKIFLV